MTSLRFPLALGVALAFGAAAAHAQSAPTTSPAIPAIPATKIVDIEVAQEGDSVSILVKLSGQPSAASALVANDQLRLQIDGVDLAALSLSPPAGSLIASVTAAKGEIVMGGVALAAPDVVIYRHAVLIKARLAEPADIHGASLIAGAAPLLVAPTIEPGPTSTVVTAILPEPQSPAELPLQATEPIVQLQSTPAPATAPSSVGPATSLAGLETERCAAAADELAKDSWALAAMGDVALCLIDQGKADEARARLDQLGAITPQDWRVSLGRALLAADADDMARANELLLTASLGAPTDMLRAAIIGHIQPVAVAVPALKPAHPQDSEPDLQIPLPK